MFEGVYWTDGEENRWWRGLPLVPAVTGLLLRQQTRRRWKPVSLAHLCARLPRLQEIHYEPWRELSTDQSFFESLASGPLRRLIVFENFNQQYTSILSDPIRIPTFEVSQAVANASPELEHLSVSFIVDASYFFDACKPSWK